MEKSWQLVVCAQHYTLLWDRKTMSPLDTKWNIFSSVSVYIQACVSAESGRKERRGKMMVRPSGVAHAHVWHMSLKEDGRKWVFCVGVACVGAHKQPKRGAGHASHRELETWMETQSDSGWGHSVFPGFHVSSEEWNEKIGSVNLPGLSSSKPNNPGRNPLLVAYLYILILQLM